VPSGDFYRKFSEIEGPVCEAAHLAVALAMAIEGKGAVGKDEEKAAIEYLTVTLCRVTENARELWYDAHNRRPDVM
jgi:hypothetical protein